MGSSTDKIGCINYRLKFVIMYSNDTVFYDFFLIVPNEYQDAGYHVETPTFHIRASAIRDKHPTRVLFPQIRNSDVNM